MAGFEFPQITATSPFGEVIIWASSPNHIGARTPNGQWNLTVNGVAHSLRMDIKPLDLSVDLRRQFLPLHAGWVLDFMSLLRQDQKPASPSAVEKVKTVFFYWLAELASTDDIKLMLSVAADDQAEHRVGWLSDRLTELEAQTEVVRTALGAALRGELTDELYEAAQKLKR